MAGRTVTAWSEVDISEFDDETIADEARSRGLVGFATWDNDLERIYDAVCDGRIDDAKTYLEKHLKPMWASIQSCAADYQKALGEKRQ